MIEIRLTQGKVAIVDDCDADLAALRWCAYMDPQNAVWYAKRRVGRAEEKLHRVVAKRAGSAMDR